MEELAGKELFGLLTVQQLLVIFHLIGLAIGAGAAFFSDFLFTHSLKDRKITRDELAALRLNSQVVWLGLSILIISGILLFLCAPERLSESPKFLAKMTVVALLALNGIAFHRKHLPLLARFTNKNLRKEPVFIANSRGLFMSGAVSGVSWMSALVLGAMPYIDYSYFVIMSVYAAAVLLAVLSSLPLHAWYLKTK